MPTREEMRSLAEGIVGSYADRVAGIAELRETVKMDRQESWKHLTELRNSRATTGKQIRADLARSMTERKHKVADMLTGFDAELTELGQARATMSKELKSDLARSAANLQQGVDDLIHGFNQARAAINKEMRAELAKSVSNRRREVSIMKRGVLVMLKGFDEELKEIRSEEAGGRDEWQILTATMQSKRGGVAVALKPAVKEVAEEAAAEITPEIANLRDRVFEYLANNPDGTRMTELEKEFGLARIQAARLLRSLMDENKVEKRDLLYFAI